ncbi:MAG: PorP/SprF family type IX secretion system membrane protein [Bacteroidales bacterium]|nr:PorP/SprF family type IX secretion system membrane protein [Bacteroidales bacterium]
MKKKTIIFLIIISISSSIIKAQQVFITDFNFINGYLLNPAKAGDSGTKLFWINRQQWKDIPGAPEITVVSIETRVSDRNIGLGAFVISDSDNFLRKTTIGGSYNYCLKLGEKHFLSMAISPGIVTSQLDFNNIRTDEIEDPLLFSNVQNATNFCADAGLNYKFRNLNFGFSVFQLTGTRLNYKSQIDGNYLNYQLVQHFVGQLSYTFIFANEKFLVEPSVVGRSTIGLPIQFEAGVNLSYNDLVQTRIGYRYNSNAYLAIGFNLYDDLTVGCGYEYSLGEISGYSGSSYEVIIGYRLKRRNDMPNYKKIDKAENQAIKSSLENQSQKIDEVIYKNDQLNENIKKTNEEMKLLKEEIDNLKNNSKLSPEDLELLKQIQNQHGLKDEEFEENDVKDSHIINTDSNSNNDEIFKDEINTNQKFCVIVGAYLNLETAKQGQKILLRELGLSTTIIQDSEAYFYFICSDFFDNKEDVAKEKQRLMDLNVESFIIGKPWTYKTVDD